MISPSIRHSPSTLAPICLPSLSREEHLGDILIEGVDGADGIGMVLLQEVVELLNDIG